MNPMQAVESNLGPRNVSPRWLALVPHEGVGIEESTRIEQAGLDHLALSGPVSGHESGQNAHCRQQPCHVVDWSAADIFGPSSEVTTPLRPLHSGERPCEWIAPWSRRVRTSGPKCSDLTIDEAGSHTAKVVVS